MPLPIERQAELLVNVLTYDRTQRERLRKGFTVGVLCQSRVQRSARVAREFTKALPRAVKTIPGRVRIVRVEMGSREELARQLHDLKVAVVYVTPLHAADMAVVADVCAAGDILSFTGVQEYIRQGVGVGLVREDGKPLILVNLAATQAAGSRFSSQLLRMARVVE
jgi:ABC-type transporter Mla maintaining outer membrane lipid asymmetry permease subunit MlaE